MAESSEEIARVLASESVGAGTGYPGPSRPRARPSPTAGRTRPRSGTPGRRCKRHIVEPMGGCPRSRDIPRRTAVPIAQDVTQGWRGNVWLLRTAGSDWCQFTQSNGGAVGPCRCRDCHPLGRVAWPSVTYRRTALAAGRITQHELVLAHAPFHHSAQGRIHLDCPVRCHRLQGGSGHGTIPSTR